MPETNAPSLEYFNELEGKEVSVHIADKPVPAKVVECKRIRGAREGEQRDPFNVTFLIDGDEPYPQASYEFDLPGIGLTAMFIVPIEKADEGILYEAVFT